MKKIFLTIPLAFISIFALGQMLPEAPAVLEFAGVNIELNLEAREKVNKEINSLLTPQNSYLDQKLERIQWYLPLIERVLEEEQVPDDIKYIAILESGLNSHLISSSKAVGFWQFKEETAKELNLTINSQVDERENIEASTRAAATYFKKNNQVLKNWLSSALAYNLGATGASLQIPSNWAYAKKVDINGTTHPYLIKAISNRIAFEHRINRTKDSDKVLIEYPTSGQSLREIGKNLNVDYNLLKQYNSWLKALIIPSDKNYMVVFPAKYTEEEDLYSLIDKNPKISNPKPSESITLSEEKEFVPLTSSSAFPVLKQLGRTDPNPKNPSFYTINGKKGILAKPGLQTGNIAKIANINPYKFLKYNDLTDKDLLKEGSVYYLQKKDRKAKVPYHTAKANETLWDISQDYGVRLKNLLKYNRLDNISKLQTGQVVYMQKKRPRNKPVEIAKPIIKEKEEVMGAKEYVRSQDPIKPLNETEEKAVIPITKSKETLSTPSSPEETKSAMVITETPKDINYDYTPKAGEHVVAAGETLNSISKKYGVNVYDIKRWNNLNSDNISFNQVLRVKGSPSSTTTTTSSSTPQKYPTVIKTIEDEEFGEPAVVLGPKNSTTTSGTPTRTYSPSNSSNTSNHVVSKGETLFSISNTYGTTVENIKSLNGLINNTISVGQNLRVSGYSGQPVSLNGPSNNNVVTSHTVTKGETLFSISKLYNTTVNSIKAQNNLHSNEILIGQILKIGTNQTNSSVYSTYTVKKGDTLFSISQMFNTSVNQIKTNNNLSSNAINIGQVLQISQ